MKRQKGRKRGRERERECVAFHFVSFPLERKKKKLIRLKLNSFGWCASKVTKRRSLIENL